MPWQHFVPVLVLCTGAALLATACGHGAAPAAAAASVAGTAAAGGDAAARAAASDPFAGRHGELINPDASAVVFLYYDLAGLAAPIAEWVEEDARVKYAAPLDKPARRGAVKAELEAARAAVHGIGALRLSTEANLSDYDPSNGEFTVRALSPSSVFSFAALGQKVALNLANGQRAQIWRVPAAQAQGIRDQVSGGSVTLDVLLRLRDVQPGVAGGSLTAAVVTYELREARSGTTLARVQLDDQQH